MQAYGNIYILRNCPETKFQNSSYGRRNKHFSTTVTSPYLLGSSRYIHKLPPVILHYGLHKHSLKIWLSSHFNCRFTNFTLSLLKWYTVTYFLTVIAPQLLLTFLKLSSQKRWQKYIRARDVSDRHHFDPLILQQHWTYQFPVVLVFHVIENWNYTCKV